MKQRKVEILLRAREPIAHHAQSFGNTAVAMRRKLRRRDGSFVQVPIISADTMRHGLREAAAYAYLSAAGMLAGGGLSEEALRLLFAGGMITGSAGGAVKLGDYRTMVDLMPPLALLGGCAQNRCIPGRLFVDDAVLVCEESEDLTPAWVRDYLAEDRVALDTHRAHVEEVQRVRMDPTLVPEKRALLTGGAQAAVEHRLLRSENASVLDDAAEKDATKSSMLPRRYERVVAGSLFYWRVTCTTVTDLDEATFFVMLAAFLGNARVGGKKGTGHGLIEHIVTRDVAVRRPDDVSELLDPTEESQRHVDLFREHVAARSEKIKAFLAEVAA